MKRFKNWVSGTISSIRNPQLNNKNTSKPRLSLKRYSKQEFIEIAAKYDRKSDFKSKDKNAYEAAQKRGLLEEIYEEIGLKNQNLSWDLESVEKLARKCKNATEMSSQYPGAYGWAKKNGLVKHLSRLYLNPTRKYFSEDEIRKLANSCQSLNTFLRMKDGRIARRARKLGIYKEVTAHMTPGQAKNNTRYAVYALVNQRLKQVYVGVTNRPLKERISGHKEPTNTCRSAELMQAPDTSVIQASDYIYTSTQVRNKNVEKRLADLFESDGYDVLNDPSAYGLCGGGQPSKYTETSLALEAQRFQTRSAFKKHSGGAYRAAQRKGSKFLAEITAHMPNPRPKHWKHVSKSKVLKEIKRQKLDGCKTRSELFKRSQSLHHRVNTLGLMDELFPSKNPPKRTDAELIKIAKEYKSAADLRNKHRRIYKQLSNRKLLQKAFVKK